MPIDQPSSVRAKLLELVHEIQARREGGNLQQTTVLSAAERALVPLHGDTELEQAILTQWNELFRTGLLAWGYNLANPNPPFFHLTESGVRALANATRDPSNPAGYLKHLETRAMLDPVAKAYMVEGLQCYVAGLSKAGAVMVGVAAESMVLQLRDLVVEKRAMLGRNVAKELKGWQLRPITFALADLFSAEIDAKRHRELRDRYDMFWSAFAGQIRAVRNDAGHRSNIEPVTADAVHASLLVFPELARLVGSLREWVERDM